MTAGASGAALPPPRVSWDSRKPIDFTKEMRKKHSGTEDGSENLRGWVAPSVLGPKGSGTSRHRKPTSFSESSLILLGPARLRYLVML